MATQDASLNKMYQLAEYYDIVFSRDVAPHVKFCIDAFAHYVGRKPASALDLACGPGYYAREFARQGVRAVGLDLSAGMLAFARDRAAKEGLDIQFVEADMRSFRLDAPVDLIVGMFDCIDFLLDHDALIEHFQSVAANLTPNGLCLIQQTPSARSHSVYNPGAYTYKGQRDGIDVQFLWGTNNPMADVSTGVMAVEMEIRVNDHGQEAVYHDRSIERVCLPSELTLVAERISGAFKRVGSYGGFDLNQPPDWLENTLYLITIFQKTASTQ